MSRPYDIDEKATPRTRHYVHGVMYCDTENEQEKIEDSKAKQPNLMSNIETPLDNE